MPPVNDSNNIPGSAGPLLNGSAGNSSNDNDKTALPRKFTFPSHQFHMVHLAKMCQENKEYTDCVIRVGNADGGDQQGQELRAHRLVLGSVSPFLKLVFADLPQNHSEATILVPGVQRRVVKALLDFFYTGQMTVERQDTTDLQLLIDTLQIDPGLITVDTVSKHEPPTSAGNVEGSTKSETDTVTTTTTATPNKKIEKSRETPTSLNKPDTPVTVDTNRKPNHEGSDESQNSDFFGRMIDRKRKTNEDHDESDFSSKKRIVDTNDSEGDEEASK